MNSAYISDEAASCTRLDEVVPTSAFSLFISAVYRADNKNEAPSRVLIERLYFNNAKR